MAASLHIISIYIGQSGISVVNVIDELVNKYVVSGLYCLSLHDPLHLLRIQPYSHVSPFRLLIDA